jgi:hypothetical protein
MGDGGKRRSSRKREKGKERWFRKRIGTVGGVEVCVWICGGARDEDKTKLYIGILAEKMKRR